MAINFLNNVSVVETAASSDTDKFVVLDSGVLKYRTGAQVRSDIGAGTMSSWTIKEGNGTESTTVSNFETFTIAQGSGIQSEMTSTSSGGTITITNTDRGSSQNIFKNFAVSGQSTVVADSNNDTITLATTGGLTITTNATTDTITLNNTITNNNQLTNGAGYITSASLPTVNNGTLTMTTSTGLDGGATFTANQSGNSTFSVSLDLSELIDMTAAMTSTDEFIVLDSSAERRKAAGEIGLSIFDNDEGFITSSSLPTVNNATITISAGTDMAGGGNFTTNQGVNETITVNHADTSTLSGTYGSTSDGTKIDQITVDARGHVTAITTGSTGDITGVTAGTNLNGGATSGNATLNLDSAIELTSVQYGSGVTLSESSDRADLLYINSSTSSWGGLQIGNTSNEFIFSLMGDGSIGGIYDDQNSDWLIQWTENSEVRLYHNASERLNTSSSGVTITGDLTVTGGDIVLNGTGRIQGVDTVSSGTDAANKTYVDNAIAGVPQGDITAVTAGTNLTGGGTSGAVTLNMATGGIGSGTYGSTANGTKIDNITVDAYGRVTAITTGATGSGNGTVTGSGTANYVSKWTSGSAQGNSTIYDNGSVGIGTTNPDGKLHIDGVSDTVSGLVLEASNSGDNRSIDFQNTAGALRLGIEYDNTNINLDVVDRNRGKLFTIRESGNVGIGTTSPATKLEVEGGDALLQLSTTSSSGSPYMSFAQAGTRRSFIQHTDSSDTLKIASEYGGIDFYTGTSGSETEKMTIQSDGDVGINVTSPSSKLHVRKAAGPLSSFNSNTIGIFETSGPGYVNIVTGASNTGELWFSDSLEGRGRVRYNHVDDSLQFWVANNEQLRIGTDGQIGIGGTNYGSSGQVLTSNGSGSAPSWQAAGGGGNEFASGLYIGGTAAVNLLDDYEEGTYTPTLSFSYSGGLFPSTSTLGRYQKIGNTVFVDGYAQINGGSGQTPTFNSVTLPFTVEKNTSSGYAVGGTNSSWDPYDNDYFCRAKDGTTTLNFPSAANNNDTTTGPTSTDFYSAKLYFQIRYRTT